MQIEQGGKGHSSILGFRFNEKSLEAMLSDDMFWESGTECFGVDVSR